MKDEVAVMELCDLRREIDAVDADIARLFKKRMEICAEIGRLKKTSFLPVRDSAREAEILSSVKKITGDELAGYAEALYNTVFSLSRSYQQSLSGKINP